MEKSEDNKIDKSQKKKIESINIITWCTQNKGMLIVGKK